MTKRPSGRPSGGCDWCFRDRELYRIIEVMGGVWWLCESCLEEYNDEEDGYVMEIPYD